MDNFNLMGFVPPTSYACYFKNIPIAEYTPELRKQIRKIVGRSVYFKFRGPRYRKDHCLKQDAIKFDVYPRNYY